MKRHLGDPEDSSKSTKNCKNDETFIKQCICLEREEKGAMYLRYHQKRLKKSAAQLVIREKKLKNKQRGCNDSAPSYINTVQRDVEMLRTRFPREIRDLVYEAMYLQKEAIQVTSKQRLFRGIERSVECEASKLECRLWLNDPSTYLDHKFVGGNTSRESAYMFYGCNTFVIYDIGLLKDFCSHDHYDSGVYPGKHVQKLLLLYTKSPPSSRYRDWRDKLGLCQYRFLPDNIAFVRQKPSQRDRGDWANERDRVACSLEVLYGMPKLKELVVYIRRRYDHQWDLREIASVVTYLRNKHVMVTVRTAMDHEEELALQSDSETSEGTRWKDISSYIDPPTEEDKKLLTVPPPVWTPWMEEWMLNAQWTVKVSKCTPPKQWKFDFTCLDGNDCSEDLSWEAPVCIDHRLRAGWYRAMLHEYNKLQTEHQNESK